MFAGEEGYMTYCNMGLYFKGIGLPKTPMSTSLENWAQDRGGVSQEDRGQGKAMVAHSLTPLS